MSGRKLNRRGLREQIFILVFMAEFNEPDEMDERIERYLSDPDRNADEGSLEYIRKKASHILELRDKLDDTLNTYAEKWNTSRMGKVELAVFRLAKKYGPDDAPSFINGILANIVREMKL